MQLEQIRSYFQTSPALRLLRGENAMFVIDFLNSTFKQSGALELGHEELRQRLLGYIEQIQDEFPNELKGNVDRYLISWSDSGFLNRHLQSASSQPHYQLTRHSEDAIQFVDLLISRRTGLVGTESRLRLIIDTLSDLVRGSSSDPVQRMAYLEEQKDQIQRKIDALKTNGVAEVYKPSQIRERFQMAVGLLKTLQSDFRAVEERFLEIARNVQENQQTALETRGEILGSAMDAEDHLKTEDEGISFYAFIAFLFSPDGQQSLRETIEKVIQIEEIQSDSDSIARLRTMVKSLLKESDKVLATNGRLSSTLRKLLDTTTAEDRRQTSEVIRDIKQLACQLRSHPPSDEAVGASVQSTADIYSPFTRTFWDTPQSFDTQPENHLVDLEKVGHEINTLADFEMLDVEQLRRNIDSLLESEQQVSLEEILAIHPPKCGVLELIGYFQVAFDDGHSINRGSKQTIAIEEPKSGHVVRVSVPKITFQKLNETLKKAKPR